MSLPLTRIEHAAMWGELPDSAGMGLSEYAERLDKIKGTWPDKYFGGRFMQGTQSNARWVAHLSECVELGIGIPVELLSDPLLMDDMKYDSWAFGGLIALMKESAP